MNPEKLLELAVTACDAAKNAGADFVEVSIGEAKGSSLKIERSAVDSTEVRFTSGGSIRAFKNGGLGAVRFDCTDADEIVKRARQAAEMASFAVPDKDFLTLPEPAEITQVPGLYDAGLESWGVPELAGVAERMISDAQEIESGAVCTGSASCSVRCGAMANSLGVRWSSRSSSVGAWLEPIIRQGDDVGAYYEWSFGRRLEDFHPERIGKTAAEAARRFLGAKQITSGQMPVILGPLAASGLLGSLAASAEAESHQRGRSWLLGKVGQKVASSEITLIDDPTIPAGGSSRSCDSEGVPSRQKVIIQDGYLLGLLHNSYTANKAKEPYTGHASGGGISPSNVIPTLGSITEQEIIENTKEGLYIYMGSLSPNAVTGEVSATVDFGFYIENGKLAYPVSNCVVGMNGLEMLANIDAISSDARIEPGAVMPSLRIQGVRVAGGR